MNATATFLCRYCNHQLPTSAYFRAPATARGFSYECRDCCNARRRERNKARRIAGIFPTVAKYRGVKKYRARYPERIQAHKDVMEAVRSGILIKPEACSQCGDSPRNIRGKSLIQGHHEDYSKPLEVVWLCARCHTRRHLQETR